MTVSISVQVTKTSPTQQKGLFDGRKLIVKTGLLGLTIASSRNTREMQRERIWSLRHWLFENAILSLTLRKHSATKGITTVFKLLTVLSLRHFRSKLGGPGGLSRKTRPAEAAIQLVGVAARQSIWPANQRIGRFHGHLGQMGREEPEEETHPPNRQSDAAEGCEQKTKGRPQGYCYRFQTSSNPETIPGK